MRVLRLVAIRAGRDLSPGSHYSIAAGGATTLDNLALACVHCSLRKGAKVFVKDPKTSRKVRLFHPRDQQWNHHFRWSGNKLSGITSVGRATISTMDLNSTEHQIIRSFESILKRHPPPGHV